MLLWVMLTYQKNLLKMVLTVKKRSIFRFLLKYLYLCTVKKTANDKNRRDNYLYTKRLARL